MIFRLLLIVLLAAVSTPEKSGLERYVWQDERELVWEDYKGKPEANSLFAAVTSSGISHEFLISNGVLDKKQSQVYAYFYPTMSWYNPETATPSVLRHERTHFDITELHARMLRKRIAAFEFTENSSEEVKRLYLQVEQARTSMQKAFDKETIHSLRKDAEAFWEAKINLLLTEHKDWK